MKGVILPGLLIGSVLGVIYSGLATVTESAAIGAVGALLVGALRSELTWTMARGAMRQTVPTVGSIIWLVLGAVSLIGIYHRIGGGEFLRGMLTGLDTAPIMVIAVMMLIVMVLGTFLEWIAIIFIAVPIFAPGGDRTWLRSGLVRRPVRHEYPDPSPAATFRTGVLLPEIGRAEGDRTSGYLRCRPVLHRAAGAGAVPYALQPRLALSLPSMLN